MKKLKNNYFFLRHAETQKDPETNAKDWVLTDDALLKINEYINTGILKDVNIIFTSKENKAIATAKPITLKYGLLSLELENFNEIRRSNKFLNDEEFLIQKRNQMTNLSTEIDGGESGISAIERFEIGMQKIDEMFDNKTILIVTHGTIMSLYFAKIKNELPSAFERWQSLKFCALGEIKQNKIIKDII